MITTILPKHLGKIEDLPEFDNHKFISFFYDKDSGLRGFISIHNDNLGPGIGGTRMWHYDSELEGLKDVLKLSRAMTYKCALAEVKYGGAKGVIINDISIKQRKKALRKYAEIVNYLKGNFFTGEDVGLNGTDVIIMSEVSPYFIGKPNDEKYHGSGDPSPFCSLSVFKSIQASFKKLNGSFSLSNKTFAIKGIGKTGSKLVELLSEEGAKITVADIYEAKIKKIIKKFPKIKVVSPTKIHMQKVDVYVPCALGDEFTQETVEQLKCKIICGAANNQLASKEVGKQIYEKGILYLPDYVVNSGGLINVADELESGGYDRSRVMNKIDGIKDTIIRIIEESNRKKLPTNEVADIMAEKIFKKISAN